MTKTLYYPLLTVSIFYQVVNLIQTKVSGKPVYTFMPWDPISETAMLVAGMIAGFTVVYFIFVKIDEHVKLPIKKSKSKTQ